VCLEPSPVSSTPIIDRDALMGFSQKEINQKMEILLWLHDAVVAATVTVMNWSELQLDPVISIHWRRGRKVAWEIEESLESDQGMEQVIRKKVKLIRTVIY
jgi:hypothetical protein